ncbi:uncharacterized protein RJT21DRAFT_142161 [Scheffersomyces amazonensis]|uniref:uncharacterized protein n=1 Tax=Scheffersomyces amazonensis TaxID=1078765 RepID=UPI00315D83A0
MLYNNLKNISGSIENITENIDTVASDPELELTDIKNGCNDICTRSINLLDLPKEIIENIIFFLHLESGSCHDVLSLLYTTKILYYPFHYLVYKFNNPLLITGDQTIHGVVAVKGESDLSILVNKYSNECSKIRDIEIHDFIKRSNRMTLYTSSRCGLSSYDKLILRSLKLFKYLNSISLVLSDAYGLRLLNYFQTCSSSCIQHLNVVVKGYKWYNFNRASYVRGLIKKLKDTKNDNDTTTGFTHLKSISIKSASVPIKSSTIHTSFLIFGRFEQSENLFEDYFRSPAVQSFEKYNDKLFKSGLFSLGELIYYIVNANRQTLECLEFIEVDLFLVFPTSCPSSSISSSLDFSFPKFKLLIVDDASYLKLTINLFKFHSNCEITILNESSFTGSMMVIKIKPATSTNSKRKVTATKVSGGIESYKKKILSKNN